MNWVSSFPHLSLKTPDQYYPQRLTSLCKNLGHDNSDWGELFKLKKQDVIIRPIDGMMDQLLEDSHSSILPIEWLLLLSEEKAWNNRDPAIANKVASRIWERVTQDSMLSYLIFNLLAAHLVNQDAFPYPLLKEFEKFKINPAKSHELKCKLVEILAEKSKAPELFIQLAIERRQSPQRMLNIAQLSAYFRPFREAYRNLIKVWHKSKPKINQKWLIDAFEELPEDHLITCLEDLVAHIPVSEVDDYKEIGAWIKKWYRKQSLRKLSPQAQQALNKWVGAATFGDFEKLIKQLIHLEYWAAEKNRLEKRCAFWSNYSHRFNELRILLPQTSKSASDSWAFNLSGISMLSDDDIKFGDRTTPTEICIMELDNFIAVEFLRGSTNEFLIFSQNPVTRKILFEEENLSSRKIRYLGSVTKAKTVDHVFGWQYHAERKLYEQGMLPNEGEKTKRFRIGFNEWKAYSLSAGTQVPDIYEREKGLKSWQKNIDGLKSEAINSCKDSAWGVRIRSALNATERSN